MRERIEQEREERRSRPEEDSEEASLPAQVDGKPTPLEKQGKKTEKTKRRVQHIKTEKTANYKH